LVAALQLFTVVPCVGVGRGRLAAAAGTVVQIGLQGVVVHHPAFMLCNCIEVQYSQMFSLTQKVLISSWLTHLALDLCIKGRNLAAP
jgi:hypothetical protein